jgi:uncharacterized protein YraI
MSLKRNILLAGMILASSAGLAQAEMSATTISDIDVRTGPGSQYPTVGTATRGSEAILDGCVAGSRWCRIDVNGMRGWVYAQYLSVEQNGGPVIVDKHSDDLGVPVVTYQQTDDTSTGSVQQQAQPGPDDELIGPADDDDTVTPPKTVRAYIDENPVDAVELNGTIAVGSELPHDIAVRTIPDYQYSYVRVNGQAVLVDPDTHRVVYVYN